MYIDIQASVMYIVRLWSDVDKSDVSVYSLYIICEEIFQDSYFSEYFINNYSLELFIGVNIQKSSHENHSVLCVIFENIYHIYHFILAISSFLIQWKVKEKEGVKSLDINNYFLFYHQNPQFTNSKMFYVLCPMTLRL